jgi:hypothetical protein
MKFKTEEGALLNTSKAKQSWQEQTRWNGNNHISVNTGSQWTHETLYKSAKDRYYIVFTSQWQGSSPSARFVEPEEAARWLILNDEELPTDLLRFEHEVEQ